MRFTGEIKDGKLKLYDTSGFKRYISKLDGSVWIDVKVAPKSSSPQQNGYYRYIIRELANHLGYTENEMHKTFKEKFGIESTKHLSVDDFSDYISKIQRFSATELDYPIEDPRGR